MNHYALPQNLKAALCASILLHLVLSAVLFLCIPRAPKPAESVLWDSINIHFLPVESVKEKGLVIVAAAPSVRDPTPDKPVQSQVAKASLPASAPPIEQQPVATPEPAPAAILPLPLATPELLVTKTTSQPLTPALQAPNQPSSIGSEGVQSAASPSSESSTQSVSVNLRPSGGFINARPRSKFSPEPLYPVAARRRGLEGLVTLRLLVNASGKADRVEIAKSSGFSLLDEAAIAAVKRWDFEPGERAGKPAASQVDIPIRFRLQK
ncbi:MAG: TonB family protein [Verrucomicrobiales bacterium]|nr:TonB family protein [Verrucomicrobiales bacterium]